MTLITKIVLLLLFSLVVSMFFLSALALIGGIAEETMDTSDTGSDEYDKAEKTHNTCLKVSCICIYIIMVLGIVLFAVIAGGIALS